MKRILSLISVIVIISMMLCLSSCDIINGFFSEQNSDVENPEANGDATENTGVWASATYVTDKEFGNGSKTLYVKVEAEGKSVTFTIHTNKETVGEALFEHDLIDGEEGAYGLYVKFVNGIEADYDKDQTYWAFYQNGEYMMTGVDSTVFADGAHYELVKEK